MKHKDLTIATILLVVSLVRKALYTAYALGV